MAHNRLDERLIERCEDIPQDPKPGAYVVIDTMHFSNTVIELLARGAAHVHVPEERGEEFDYRAAHPDALIGGGRTAEYDPEDGYDFFNSPSYVEDIDVEGRPVSMTSTNGGRTVATLRERGSENVDVFVGAPLNARAIGRFLRRTDHPVHLVCAGYQGEIAIEDHVGAALISRYLDEIPPAETEIELFRDQLETAKGPDYVRKNAIRRRDVRAYAMNVNGREMIPELSGDSLVRARAPLDRLPGSEDWQTEQSATRETHRSPVEDVHENPVYISTLLPEVLKRTRRRVVIPGRSELGLPGLEALADIDRVVDVAHHGFQ